MYRDTQEAREDPSLGLSKESCPPGRLDIRPLPSWTVRIRFCCSKPFGLWFFVKAALRLITFLLSCARCLAFTSWFLRLQYRVFPGWKKRKAKERKVTARGVYHLWKSFPGRRTQQLVLPYFSWTQCWWTLNQRSLSKEEGKWISSGH